MAFGGLPRWYGPTLTDQQAAVGGRRAPVLTDRRQVFHLSGCSSDLARWLPGQYMSHPVFWRRAPRFAAADPGRLAQESTARANRARVAVSTHRPPSDGHGPLTPV